VNARRQKVRHRKAAGRKRDLAPRSLNARASVAARFRWPMPSRCWT
jgi:hypothetical protein